MSRKPAGTIFHKSRTPLTKWFLAMYLMTSTRSGVAAKELERGLGVTYKCAWRMAHELRKLMASADYGGSLGGDGEARWRAERDVARRQGPPPWQRPRQKTIRDKTVVFGMVRT